MDEVAAPRLWLADHEVHLRAVAQDHARLVAARCEHAVDRWQGVEGRDERLRVVRRREEVEIADRGASPAERTRRLQPSNPRHVAQPGEQLADQLVGVVEQEPGAALLDPRDSLEDALLGAGGEALEATQLPLLGGGAQLLDRADAELVVQQPDRSRTDAADPQHLEQPTGNLGTQPVVVLEAAGPCQLRELGAQRVAGAGNPGWIAGAVPGRDVLRPAFDRVRDSSVRHRLVDDLAEDLEHVADLVEDARQLAVADDAITGARRTARSGHGPSF